MSQALKTFLYIIHERIYKEIERNLSESQFGFRCGLGTRDALFGLQVLLQRCRDLNSDVYICFIDLEKAFDKVKHQILLEILKKTGINGMDLRIINNLYFNQTAHIRIEDSTSEDIVIKRGVRQGCVLSPLLFNLYSEEMFGLALDEVTEGIRINGETVNNLRYADDTVIMANNIDELQILMDKISSACEDFGLKINVQKTKFMIISRSTNTDCCLRVYNQPIQRVNKFKYLGCIINDNIDHELEIRCRIEQARTAYFKMKKVLTCKDMKLNLRVRLAKCYIFSTLLYGMESWTISDRSLKRLEAFEMWVYRRMLRVSWTDRMTNASVLESMEKDCEIIKSIKIRKLQYFGHIMRNSKYRILQLIIEGKIEGRRPRGRRKISWLRDLRHWYGKTSIELFRAAANKIAIANMIANVR